MSVDGDRTIIVGLGNLLFRDEGAGIHVLRRLAKRDDLPDAVSLLDGGTVGLGLLGYLRDAQRVVIVDAADLGAAPGTVRRLQGEDCGAAFSAAVSAHELGLADLLGAASLTGWRPRELVLWCVQPGSTELGLELTPPVEAQVGPLAARIVDELVRCH